MSVWIIGFSVFNENHLVFSNYDLLSELILKKKKFFYRFHQLCEAERCRAVSCDLPVSRTYVVYHVAADVIRVDGLLEEEAWKEVAWTEEFVGMYYVMTVWQLRILHVLQLQTKKKD